MNTLFATFNVNGLNADAKRITIFMKVLRTSDLIKEIRTNSLSIRKLNG